MTQILLQIFILAVGFIMLIKGADWFVEGASKIADRFGIPQLVIGLTIVAFGTSAPEAAVSIAAAMKGSAAITIGNVVGSNIMNVLVILGITSIIVPLAVGKTTFKYEIPFMILVSILLTYVGIDDGVVSPFDGMILWLGMIGFLVYLLRMAKKGQAPQMEEEPEQLEKKDSVPRLLLYIALGMGLIIWGADLSVDAATALARVFGVSERIIALTIVALGTSLPELVTSITAGIRGNADIAIGNIVGSNIFNLLFVVGTTALITPVAYNSGFLTDSLVMIGAAVLLFVCVLKSKSLKRKGGIVMLVAYGAYFVYLIR